ncbi:hypothetical protein K504DRAFT_463517 [Pleomassaria siparia CBS 279.74]|uniref:Uncharacterized protein n=1 Tax=Pleomassaria siparia CBS 279.74 TaxID=1314801 RepID=A0A6G1JS68_9PLEO|nr:hypothetical protein K504DRAFT_463517 [Pleomassaria siparia CBS 279.74]
MKPLHLALPSCFLATCTLSDFTIPDASLAYAGAGAGAGAGAAGVGGALQNILKNTDGSDKYSYPTDLTRGIIPKPFHSHNDYWRPVPFYSGLSYGAVSTEADVWLINGTLFVGHQLSALTRQRTLESLYISPILDTLQRQNPTTIFAPSPTKHGVFDADSEQTLYLFIDVKTDGPSTWAAVLSALTPLLDRGYLSGYDGRTFTSGPVTVVGTGNAPLSAVQAAVPRYAFYDAPLALLDSSFANLTSDDSPIASVNFADVFGDDDVVVRGGGALGEDALVTLRRQVKVAHDKGIKTRYWNQPAWPVGARNRIWKQLWDEGVDLLNVDDLSGAAGFWDGT